jgi:glycosyltransferase involved in cell wall biosynthesis
VKILLASGLAHAPQIAGGSISSVHELALHLHMGGHDVAVLAAIEPRGYVGFRTRALMKLLRKRTVRDDIMGYPVYRRWNVCDSLDDAVSEIRPDLVIVQAVQPRPIAITQEFIRLSIPTIVYFHDVLVHLLEGDPRALAGARFMANSQFTAGRYNELFGIDCVVLPPLFRAERYRTKRRSDAVTFINPQPLKGSARALEIAELCPDIPFCFVESWALPKSQEQAIRQKMKTLRNLTLRFRTTDMKSVYRNTKILLAPSKYEEGWGRVASEAHFSGIPVVASNRGALPEAVGPGGVLLDPEGPLQPWVAAIRRLWDDEAYYKAMSAAALAYAGRPELDPALQVETLLALAGEAAGRRAGAQQASPLAASP